MSARNLYRLLVLVWILSPLHGLRADPFTLSRDAQRLEKFQALSRASEERVGLPKYSERIDLRYPVVFAHGVNWLGALGVKQFQGDYWSGMVDQMRLLGVKCIAPEVPWAASIEARAHALKEAIQKAFPRGKVNIVAHSMGGLDSRYMISKLGMAKRVKSLTTLSTPHRGSFYADFAYRWLYQAQGLGWLSERAKLDYRALSDLRVRHLSGGFNQEVLDSPKVDYFSYAGVSPIWKVPFMIWGAKLVVTLAEKSAAGKPVGKATRAALEKSLPQAGAKVATMMQDTEFDTSWVDPELAGRSDGIVSVSSARWGTYLGEIESWHVGQIGVDKKFDHISMWEQILRRLQAMGY